MTKGKRWSKEEIRTLEKLVAQKAPMHVILRKIRRTADGVYAKATAENIPLVRPTSDAPNGRRKKNKKASAADS